MAAKTATGAPETFGAPETSGDFPAIPEDIYKGIPGVSGILGITADSQGSLETSGDFEKIPEILGDSLGGRRPRRFSETLVGSIPALPLFAEDTP
mmetsp:Transcript_2842/g.4310  ORF Transcript_2842/g.4310 Transcript_2842/m.4310 type:complete len:95 (-) Transcript_2842:442-726(-)